ncbi:MAG: VOC family protein [Reichenbachiella sp.]|uniref:VOC family protein n=1 Tax=Reichenbachiella sp. TaxID=2184521 RepID=UPI003264ED18
MKRVTGVGGIFYKCKSPQKAKEWYSKHLGLVTNEYGSLFEFRQGASPDKIGYLQWSPMGSDTEYYAPSKSEFMINYRVDNLVELLKVLKEEGVEIVGEMEEYEYGKFAWIMDPDGHKVELWEPIDGVFTKEYDGKTTM